MSLYPEGLDELDTSEARFGPPRLQATGEGRALVIPVVSVGVSGHPLNPSGTLRYLERAYLRFEAVLESKRQVSDYTEDGRMLEPAYAVIDVESDRALPSDAKRYRLQGVEGLDPGRYVLDWRIVASRFVLVVPDDAKLRSAPVMLDAELERFLISDHDVGGSTQGPQWEGDRR